MRDCTFWTHSIFSQTGVFYKSTLKNYLILAKFMLLRLPLLESTLLKQMINLPFVQPCTKSFCKSYSEHTVLRCYFEELPNLAAWQREDATALCFQVQLPNKHTYPHVPRACAHVCTPVYMQIKTDGNHSTQEIINSTEGLSLLPFLANHNESLLVENGLVQLGALQTLGSSTQAVQ